MKSIDIHLRENLAERATEMGAYFIKRLREIGEKRTKIPIKDIRGKGLLIAVEFSEDARHIVEELKDNGILAKDTHSTTIRFAPPLVINREEIDWAIDINEKILIQE